METIRELEIRAWRARRTLVDMFAHNKAHHYGGSLSCAEILVSLYFRRMNISLATLTDPRRDRFIMSKGHSVPTQYVMLAMLGLFPMDELRTIKTLGSRLQGHPDMRKTPGIEACTGSLGQGLSVANGIALGARLSGLAFNLYVVAGDGELQEGQLWEAAMTSAHYKLGNVCLIVDRNQHQSQGNVETMKSTEPLLDKWRSFGWRAERVDGHNVAQICAALDRMDPAGGVPLAIVADTVKGKGVSFIESSHKGHNYAFTEEEYRKALAEIDAKLRELEAKS